MSYDKSRPKRCTDAFARMMRDAVDRMLAAGHETVWFGDGATFWLFTVNPERSDAIRKRLAGGPGNTSTVMAFLMYLEAFYTFPPSYGTASAIATILTLMTFGVAAYLVSRMAKS